MARRKKSSPLEDLMALVALLPWWGGVTLALVAYLGLHQVARQPVPVPTDPAQMGALLQHSLWRGLASVGQYVVPIICLVGAAASALRRRQRRALVENVSANPTADTLDGMIGRPSNCWWARSSAGRASRSWKPAAAGPMAGWTWCCAARAKPTWCSASSGAPTGWA
jgi:hypothetical protein